MKKLVLFLFLLLSFNCSKEDSKVETVVEVEKNVFSTKVKEIEIIKKDGQKEDFKWWEGLSVMEVASSKKHDETVQKWAEEVKDVFIIFEDNFPKPLTWETNIWHCMDQRIKVGLECYEKCVMSGGDNCEKKDCNEAKINCRDQSDEGVIWFIEIVKGSSIFLERITGEENKVRIVGFLKTWTQKSDSLPHVGQKVKLSIIKDGPF